MTPLKGSGDGGRRRIYAAAMCDLPILDVHRARAAWAELQHAGGLVSRADLRERWGTPGKPLSKQRVGDYTREADFPPAVEGKGAAMRWLAAEVDAWMRARIERDGRRGPKPRHFGGES